MVIAKPMPRFRRRMRFCSAGSVPSHYYTWCHHHLIARPSLEVTYSPQKYPYTTYEAVYFHGPRHHTLCVLRQDSATRASTHPGPPTTAATVHITSAIRHPSITSGLIPIPHGLPRKIRGGDAGPGQVPAVPCDILRCIPRVHSPPSRHCALCQRAVVPGGVWGQGASGKK
jgi:hypothetical protein